MKVDSRLRATSQSIVYRELLGYLCVKKQIACITCLLINPIIPFVRPVAERK